MPNNRNCRYPSTRSWQLDSQWQRGTNGLLTRRRFLQGACATAGLMVAPAILKGIRADASEMNSELFSLGVASGDPTFDSVVLWTRLAPDPLNGGGMPNSPVHVDWQISTDPGMTNIINSGGAVARPENGHSVHVLAGDLPSNSWLYYRFFAMGEASRIGRTRTFPGELDAALHMRFALVSCQDFRDGFYTAYRDMADQEHLDFVLHVGDYIYENGPTGNPIAPGRNHLGPEVFTVEEYRNRYALYRLDRNLQDAHARFPFIVTWDDHDVDNNYAGTIAEEEAPFRGQEFLIRRRNAYQVFSEMMPLPPQHQRHGDKADVRLFRKLRFGDLADIHILDTRQFRTDQPCEDGLGSLDPDSQLLEDALGEQLFCPDEILDPSATLMGIRQEAWLERNLRQSRATWNVLTQQVLMAQWNLAGLVTQLGVPIDTLFSMDSWDGYQSARQRLFDVLARVRPNNPVVLTGDIHSAWGNNLLEDFSNPFSQILAAEFVCTSISSTFDNRDPRQAHFATKSTLVSDNPHVAFFNGLFRGYCLCDVNRARWQTTYRRVGTVEDIINPDPLALVPFEGDPVEVDAVLEILAGFNAPNSGARLQTIVRNLPPDV